MRWAVALASLLVFGTAVAPVAAVPAPFPGETGILYLDATNVADPTGECATARTYLMRPDVQPLRSAPINPDPGTTGCVARFVLYNTAPFLSSPTDINFLVYINCPPTGTFPPDVSGTMPTWVFHLVTANGTELGGGPISMDGSPACLVDEPFPVLQGMFNNVSLTPQNQAGLTFQIDILDPTGALDWMLDQMSICTGGDFNRDGSGECDHYDNTGWIHNQKSMLYGDFLPGDPEEIVITPEHFVGIAPAGSYAEYRFTIENKALATDFEFAATGLPAGYKGTMNPLDGTLLPNSTVQATLRIVPPLDADRQQIPFTLTMTSGSGTKYDIPLFIEVIDPDPDAPTTTTTSDDEHEDDGFEDVIPDDDPTTTSPPPTTYPEVTSPQGSNGTPGMGLAPLAILVVALALVLRRRLA